MSELNLYQKLVEVRKSCPYLKKDNQGYQFKFVSSSQTLGTLRAAMDEQKLLLVPSVTTHETRDHTTKKGDHEYFTIATMSFTWINADKPEERETCPWLGQGLDNGEKGVGKAVTYAEKYFLLKFFNIPTDKDDPDSFQKKAVPKTPANVPLPPSFTKEQQSAIDGWKVAGKGEIGQGRNKNDWWTENKASCIKECSEGGAKLVHAAVVK